MQTWVIGNWKQNPATVNEVDDLVIELIKLTKPIALKDSCQLMIAPSYVHLSTVAKHLKSTQILIASQDISGNSADVGAFTGECSAKQLADIGVSWTLVGHSERRQYHHENNKILADKIKYALKQNLGLILCVGETLEQRIGQQTQAVLAQQLMVLRDILIDINEDYLASLSKKIIIAYEPVWAIGTGNTPSVDEVAEVHQYIRQIISQYHSLLANISIIYGGSVNANNASEFAKNADINGALVGGASLQAKSFLAIAQAFA